MNIGPFPTFNYRTRRSTLDNHCAEISDKGPSESSIFDDSCQEFEVHTAINIGLKHSASASAAEPYRTGDSIHDGPRVNLNAGGAVFKKIASFDESSKELMAGRCGWT